MKDKFYIFLDIDGVLNCFSKKRLVSEDHIWLSGSIGRSGKGGLIGMMKSRVEVFKLLYNYLCKDYTVELVISSSWRYNMDNVTLMLSQTGFDHRRKYYHTTLEDKDRGLQIAEYLVSTDEKINNNYRYVVIDDEISDIKKYIPYMNILKTSGFKGGLHKQLVLDYIKRLDKYKERLGQIENVGTGS